MKKWLLAICSLFLVLPTWFVFAQDAPATTLEITGANASDLPTITVTTNVLDSASRPVIDLSVDDFTLGGDLAEIARIVRVENIATDELPFATVLVIDTSTSMSGSPFANALGAARQFVEAVGANDPVAIITFSNNARLVQDFTTDKAVLLSVLNNLQVGGQTALYDAGVLAVETAANAPVPRRAVILLSDGAEFGGESSAERGDALTQATARGVSVYTIGLGFGIDRSYLQELASGTNARNYESPTPQELSAIYDELATLFRSQYVVTLEGDLPPDGTTYTFSLQANTDFGQSNVDTGTVRAPVPVPIVRLPDDAFVAPLTNTTTVTPIIIADDQIVAVDVLVNGEAVTVTDGSVSIDPLALAPGIYPFAVRATDVDGDSGVLETTFEIAALASNVTVNWAVGDAPITEPQTITLGVDGQTPLNNVVYTVAGNGVSVTSGDVSDAESGFAYTFDPFEVPAGAYTLTVTATNEGGATTAVSQDFAVGDVAPRNITVTGLEADQVLEEATTISVDAEAQPNASISTISVALEGRDVTLGDDLTIVPAALQPGQTNLVITVTDNRGAQSTQLVPFTIAALPPEITLGELPSMISGFVTVPVTINSQTAVGTVNYQLTDLQIPLNASNDGTFPDIPIDAVALGDGDYTLSITVTNTAGQTTTVERTFTVLLPTPTPDLTGTAESAMVTAVAQGTADAQATSVAFETAQADSATAQANADRQATVDANATQVAAEFSTREAVASATAQVEADARSTTDAQATSDAQVTLDAQSTTDAQATSDAQVTLDAQSTTDAQATSDAEQAANAEASQQAEADLQSTSDAQVTEAAAGTLTAQPTVAPTGTPTLTHTPPPAGQPTLTPIGGIVEIPSDAPPADTNLTGLVLAVGGMGLLATLLFLLFRGRKDDKK